MDELRRRMFLAAMKIEVWLPKEEQLPCSNFSDSRLHGESIFFDSDSSPSVIENFLYLNSAISEEQIKKEPLTSKKDNAIKKKTVAFLNEITPFFNLHFFNFDNILILIGSDLLTNKPFSEEEDLFLNDLVFFLNKKQEQHEPNFRPVIESICWPILKNKKMLAKQTEADALVYVQVVLRTLLKKMKISRIWLFGEITWHFLGIPEGDRKPLFCELTEFGHVWLLPALLDILNSSVLKADLWQQVRILKNEGELL